ncbi:GRF zinc finger [Diaporthe eres]|uniref:GRF zinc finger domain-containing protein n=1 Tax=Diaporthe vaccinii TaxID=105482 RepID=A0ABR4DSC7_9PEZI|nr:GRF zinc finger [Diaporthe eres]
MEPFMKRKRKATPVDDQKTVPDGHIEVADDEPTEVKLAILSSLHPDFSQEALLDVLLEHDGSVAAASMSLSVPNNGNSLPSSSSLLSSSNKAANPVVSQTSLKNFAAPHSVDGVPAPKKTKLLSRKGATLHLFDPDDIAEHTPCSIIHNFLPSELANGLLVEMLEESKTFEKITFKLFDNVVSSPHTSSFYVDSHDEMRKQKIEYLYNGARLTDVRKITPYLDKVKPLVQKSVNTEIQERIRIRCPGGVKLKHQSPGPWTPNAAFVNCYNGPGESVGWHSDQLTYLGPRAVIGSLSLGVAREFRVRRVVPKDEGGGGGSSSSAKKDADGDAGGQIAIHLPHNSLLVMHAEMQEEWKHSIAPAQAIDPHPVAGNRRINVTYRDYKASLHPSRTPKCRCGIPTVLRVVQKKKENWGRYFWMCHAGNVPGKDGCTFFQWAEFDDDGNPIWRGKGAASPQRPNDQAEN